MCVFRYFGDLSLNGENPKLMNIAQGTRITEDCCTIREAGAYGQILCCGGNASKTETRSHEGNSGTKLGCHRCN